MRRAICLECRTLAWELDACPVDARHRLVDLARERGALVEQVWGSPPRARPTPLSREELTKLLRVGAMPVLAATVWGVWAMIYAGMPLSKLFTLFVAAFVIVGASITLGMGATRLQARLTAPRARGVPRTPALRRPAEVAGVVVARTVMASPVTGEPCVAWAVELGAGDAVGGEITLRGGQSFGFDVRRLDDGSIVRIPPGPLVLAPEHDARVPLAECSVFVRMLDRSSDEDDRPALPHDRAAVVALREGDRVEVWSRALTSSSHAYRSEASGAGPEVMMIRRSS